MKIFQNCIWKSFFIYWVVFFTPFLFQIFQIRFLSERSSTREAQTSSPCMQGGAILCAGTLLANDFIQKYSAPLAGQSFYLWMPEDLATKLITHPETVMGFFPLLKSNPTTSNADFEGLFLGGLYGSSNLLGTLSRFQKSNKPLVGVRIEIKEGRSLKWEEPVKKALREEGLLLRDLIEKDPSLWVDSPKRGLIYSKRPKGFTVSVLRGQDINLRDWLESLIAAERQSQVFSSKNQWFDSLLERLDSLPELMLIPSVRQLVSESIRSEYLQRLSRREYSNLAEFEMATHVLRSFSKEIDPTLFERLKRELLMDAPQLLERELQTKLFRAADFERFSHYTDFLGWSLELYQAYLKAIKIALQNSTVPDDIFILNRASWHGVRELQNDSQAHSFVQKQAQSELSEALSEAIRRIYGGSLRDAGEMIDVSMKVITDLKTIGIEAPQNAKDRNPFLGFVESMKGYLKSILIEHSQDKPHVLYDWIQEGIKQQFNVDLLNRATLGEVYRQIDTDLLKAWDWSSYHLKISYWMACIQEEEGASTDAKDAKKKWVLTYSEFESLEDAFYSHFLRIKGAIGLQSMPKSVRQSLMEVFNHHHLGSEFETLTEHEKKSNSPVVEPALRSSCEAMLNSRGFLNSVKSAGH